jgi:hypothetical protein
VPSNEPTRKTPFGGSKSDAGGSPPEPVAGEELGGEAGGQGPNRPARIALAPDLDPARVPFRPAVTIDRPMKLGELFAETVRVYGERIWSVAGIGLFLAGSLLGATVIDHVVAFVVIVALAFTAAYAVSSRVVAGDPAVEAWAQVGIRIPVLLVLTVVVSVPFVLGRVDPLLLLFGVAWLAFVGLSIPVAMLERDPEQESWYQRIGFALGRATALARSEYLHVLGVMAAFVVVYLLIGPILAVLLTGFADNGSLAASVIANGVLGPFFFLGLSLLYFEQKARALSSPPEQST